MNSADARESHLPLRANRKVDQILEAANRLFLAHGYATTTMDEVARAAGVSKATLYVYFKGKNELFAAIVKASGDSFTHLLVEGGAGREPVRARLLRCGRAILTLLLAPEIVSSYRMVVAEAARHPELGRIYYENGAARLLDRLEEFFAEAMRRGDLRRAHPRRGAEQFIGLIRGDLQLCALLGVVRDVSEAEQDAIVRNGVDIFYRAYRPDRQGDQT
jgi:AcrR family transcriptional regulator